jgi:predicted phage terminase large subunit-like protein
VFNEEDYEENEINLEEFADEFFPILDAQKSLYSFVKQTWHLLEGPNKPFIDGWHIEALCEHLQACKEGQIQNLLINLPPRCCKSTIISAMLPAWWWIEEPSKQFFYSSYDLKLAYRDSLRTRRLIETDWYIRRWGHVYQLCSDQKNIKKFENTKLGYRACTSSRSGSTGHGGDVRICDDPNLVSIKKNQFEADAKRDAVNEWYSGAWATRFNNPKKDVNIIAQQRTNEMDLSGYLMSLEDETNKQWVKFIIPMEFEESRRCKTIIFPGNKKRWEDPREEEGELLWPDFIGQKELKKLKSNLGNEYRIAGQLQQRPAPAEGGIIKKSWFSWWKKAKPPKIYQVIQSWDTALEANEMSAYSACTTWGLFNDDNNITNIIILGLWRGRVEYPELRKMAKRLYEDYRDDGVNEIKKDGLHIPHIVLVENKASGHSLIQDFRRIGVSAMKFDPNRYGDKIQRVRMITPWIEAGRVWVPARPPDYGRLRSFSDNLVELCAVFPNSDSRDVVDTMTQVLLRLIYSGEISHPDDFEYIQKSNRVVKTYGV